MDIGSDSAGYIHVRNQSNLNFKGMRNRDDLSDVKLFCERQVFNVHRFLLAACSPYFRSTFKSNRCDKLEIGLPDVSSDDLRHVLQYIYEGSVTVKDEALQGFGELLEMFEMPLPDEMNVEYDDDDDDYTDDSYDDSSDYESESSESSSQDHGREIDEFIGTLNESLNELTPGGIEQQAIKLLKLANGSPCRLEAIINIILQQVIKLRNNCASALFSSLVNQMCNQDDTQMFLNQLRPKSSQLLKYLANAIASQRKPLQLSNDINSLDKEVIRIETIEYKWDLIRKQRLTHFVAQLIDSKIVSLADICDIKNFDSAFVDDLANGTNAENCCNLELPSAAQELLRNEEYQHAYPIENHIYWLRIENTQYELREFNGIINNEKRIRNRKGLKPNHPLRQAKKEKKERKIKQLLLKAAKATNTKE